MDDSLQIVKEIFDNAHFHHLLAVDSDKLFGVISDRDLLKALSPNIGTAAETTKELDELEVKNLPRKVAIYVLDAHKKYVGEESRKPKFFVYVVISIILTTVFNFIGVHVTGKGFYFDIFYAMISGRETLDVLIMYAINFVGDAVTILITSWVLFSVAKSGVLRSFHLLIFDLVTSYISAIGSFCLILYFVTSTNFDEAIFVSLKMVTLHLKVMSYLSGPLGVLYENEFYIG